MVGLNKVFQIKNFIKGVFNKTDSTVIGLELLWFVRYIWSIAFKSASPYQLVI